MKIHVSNRFVRPGGFTMTEMIVAVSILVIIMASVGQVFRSTGQAIGLSQAHNEMISNVRSLQEQIDRDFSGLWTGGFLVIRSQVDSTGRRMDMVTFVANGQFPNRTGTTQASGKFTDSTVATSAQVWYGQLAIQVPSATGAFATGNYVDGSVNGQGVALPIDAPPSGNKDQDFILGRHTTLLMAPDGGLANSLTSGGNPLAIFSNTGSVGSYVFATHAGYSSLGYLYAYIPSGSMPEPVIGHITDCRICTAGITPATLINNITAERAVALTPSRYEANGYCYRFKTLTSPYNTDVTGNIVNGYFRTHAIALQGAASFAVDWTDGTTWQPGVIAGSVEYIPNFYKAGGPALLSTDPRIGELRWYGFQSFAYKRALDNDPANPDSGNTTVQQATEPALGNNDSYTAIFNPANRSSWPKALRLRYRVTDSNDRLQGGREFTQIVKIPS